MSVPQPGYPGSRPLAYTSGFDDFFRRQYQGLVLFLRRRTATPQDAEDVAQESMVKLLRYRASVPTSDWQRLLYRIAINTSHDRFRGARRHHASCQRPIEECEVVSPACSPDEFATHEQELARLRQAIMSLPPKCRRVYLLKLVYGMTNAQIAQRCCVSVKMVEKHLAKGLAALRKKVGISAAKAFYGT